MKQWYCFVGGRQYGPVSEDVLRSWIAQGRVKLSDHVWADGMAEWAAAGTVFGGAAPRPADGAAVAVAPPGGTGGQTPNGDLNAQARQLLRGRWGLAIGFCVLFMLINMGISILPHIGGIVGLILTGPLQLGLVIFFLTFIRMGNAEIGMLFVGFKRFGTALGAYLLVALFVLLWLVAFAVPGIILGIIVGITTEPDAGLIVGMIAGSIPGYIAAIIAQLAYFQTFYLIADGPALGAMEAIRRSKEIMRGYKWKLFCLGLRYFCWSLLCFLTCFIGFLWLFPYMYAGYARFYDDLRPPSQVAATAAAPQPANPYLSTPEAVDN